MQSGRPPSDLAVITRAKALCSYVMQVTQKSPKAFRFTFTSRLQNLSLDVVEQLFRANEVFLRAGDAQSLARRSALQHEASTSLKMLVYVAEMAAAQGCLLLKQYEEVSKQAFEVGNLIGGWINSDKKRFGP
jgi:hypothetical protein